MDKYCQLMLELQPRRHELGDVVKIRPDPPQERRVCDRRLVNES